ncbi:MAG: aryl-sulfate sulfotransferase [Alphaproteobacteria bacterium]|nr:MAG: aryl-sulfate sulfotransferase [Alphaproteobacteria bacterium]
MNRRPRKRSVTLRGHRTSISLEEEFWQALREIAEAEGTSINRLVARIDEERGLTTGLASAVRVFTLDYFRRIAAQGGSVPRRDD